MLHCIIYEKTNYTVVSHVAMSFDGNAILPNFGGVLTDSNTCTLSVTDEHFGKLFLKASDQELFILKPNEFCFNEQQCKMQRRPFFSIEVKSKHKVIEDCKVLVPLASDVDCIVRYNDPHDLKFYLLYDLVYVADRNHFVMLPETQIIINSEVAKEFTIKSAFPGQACLVVADNVNICTPAIQFFVFSQAI